MIMVKYASYKTEYGDFKIGYDFDSIVSIVYESTNDQGEPNFLTDLTIEQLIQYFKGELKEFSIPLKITGTAFQQSVYKELLKIPYGKTVSYKDIAISIGKPKAYRAVGNANNKNPLLIVVPCHRVLNVNNIGGYALGTEFKKKLLEIEQNNINV